MGKLASSRADTSAISHNLLGQRLGRKGRDTRDRILAAASELMAEPTDAPISLSAVARRASLGMTSIYAYFSDLTELILAVLDPIMASAEEAYIGHLRQRWPDDGLREHCRIFVGNYYAFWEKHSRILHLRNSMADLHDTRMGGHRVRSARPVLDLLLAQMDCGGLGPGSTAHAMATVMFTGIDRTVTVRTDVDMAKYVGRAMGNDLPNLLDAEARLLELMIREGRAGRAQDIAPDG